MDVVSILVDLAIGDTLVLACGALEVTGQVAFVDICFSTGFTFVGSVGIVGGGGLDGRLAGGLAALRLCGRGGSGTGGASYDDRSSNVSVKKSC